jgi:hypothetical protein
VQAIVQFRRDHTRYPIVILLTPDLEVLTRSGIIVCEGNWIADLCFLGESQWLGPTK